MQIQKKFIKALTNILLSLIVLGTVFSLTSCSKKEKEIKEPLRSKDVILVLDTSLSMIGKGGSRDIMPQVKESLKKFIKNVNVGDSLTFLTFDTTVRVYPTIKINDENDKDILNKYISIVEATGKWTFTMEMFRNVLRKAEEIKAKNIGEDASRQQVIIILTDALDDPPPSDKDKQLDIKGLADEHSGEDWFIYFVNLGELQDNDQIKKLRDEMKEHISENTEIVDGSGDVDKPMSEVTADIKDHGKGQIKPKKPIYQSAWFYLLLIFLVILVAGILYSRHAAKIKLFGRLEYRNKVVLGAIFQSVNLDRYESRRISIGRDSLCQVRIADFESHVPIVMEAAFIDGELQVFVNTERGLKIKVVEGQSDPFFKDQTLFEAGGYEFIYHSKK